jgi:nitrogen fixation/metabolism regulation signal transduction histidine kinase
MTTWQKALLAVLAVVAVGTHVIELIRTDYVAHWWDYVPGFYAVFAFLGAFLLVMIAKTMGKILSRREDYYE